MWCALHRERISISASKCESSSAQLGDGSSESEEERRREAQLEGSTAQTGAIGGACHVSNYREVANRSTHSKRRTKTSDAFRDGQKLVLFSSDVSARGLDFFGVTLIIQMS